jgi:hypothetical protein
VIISKNKKFIFVHIWKTAGTSITKELIRYGDTRQRIVDDFYITRKFVGLINRLFSIYELGNGWLTGVHKHATSKEIMDFVGVDCWNDYYSFAYVRNPYDWLVSWYFYIRQAKGHHPESKEVDEVTFDEFVYRKIKEECLTQWDFVSWNGKQAVNYIGKFESLQLDFNKITKDLGLVETYIGTSNSSSRNDFLSYYNEELLAAVEQYFEKDFIEFDYVKLSSHANSR